MLRVGCLPSSPSSLTSRCRAPLLRPRPPKSPVIPEPVEMVSSPNPYAYLPSLYDLYMQAAPRTGRLERFGLERVSPARPSSIGDSHGSSRWPGVRPRPGRRIDH